MLWGVFRGIEEVGEVVVWGVSRVGEVGFVGVCGGLRHCTSKFLT